MISGKRVIALIPARAGSKTIPGKNLCKVGEHSLLAHAVRQAFASGYIDRVIVSTDGEEIAAEARNVGAEVYTRPEHLASDTALVIDTIRHVRDLLAEEGEKAPYMTLLEVTTPLRRPSDIQACLELLDENNLDSVATFKDAAINPHRAWILDNDDPRPFIDGAIPWLPRQKLPEAYQLSGAVYAFRMFDLPDEFPGLLFGKKGSVIVDNIRSIDIDDEIDLMIIRELYKHMKEDGS